MFNAALSDQIRDILTSTHTSVHGDRADIASDHATILANRHQAGADIRAVIESVRSGETDPFTGQIRAIATSMHSDNRGERQAIAVTHQDIREARQTAASDIRAAVADAFDGSTVEEIGEIIDTAHAAVATDRSVIAAEAMGNMATRRSTAVDVHEILKSAAAGDIDRDEAAAEVEALVTDSHTQIKANHVDMVSAHADIKSTKKTAAKDIHNAVKDSRTDGAANNAAKK